MFVCVCSRPVRLFSATLALVSLAACTKTTPYASAPHWSKDVYRSGGAVSSGPPSYASGSAQVEAASAHAAISGAHYTNASAPRASHSLRIMGRVQPPEPLFTPKVTGKKCLRELKRAGVRFRELDELKGVSTPVEVDGPLGGVDYWANDGRSLQMDCRLALALHSLSDVMRAHGVTRIRYSGAYSYRTTRSGRLSHHAHGLAIDLHDFELGDQTVSVERDFVTSVGCQQGIPALNELTCGLREQALFEEFLTPDYNVDHRDHLHISVPRQVD